MEQPEHSTLNESQNGETKFREEFGEDLNSFLDLSTWDTGINMPDVYSRVESEVEAAVARERAMLPKIRSEIFRAIQDKSRNGAPPYAGVHTLSLDDVKRIHSGTLFCGDVQACDGTYNLHDDHVLTAMRIGICLISYSGDQGTWEQRLYRRDLRSMRPDNLDDIYALLHARQQRSSFGRNDGQDNLTELGTRGIMTFAERAILAREATTPWRMGQGQPAPYEILTGSGHLDIVEAGIELLSELVVGHQKFVFVPSEPRQRGLLTIGYALNPLEFAVINTLTEQIRDMVEKGNLRGRRRQKALNFVNEVGPQVSVGIYRASAYAPPHLFYAPSEPSLCAQAAAIAIADSVLQSHRGFPLLLEMADRFCKSAFSQSEFDGTIRAAFAAHGGATACFSERQTRS